MTLHRRALLKAAGAASLLGTVPQTLWPSAARSAEKPDYTLRIGTGLVELAPEHIVSTTLYNGQFPGPLLRFKEGQRTAIDVYNDTDTPELVHWHGLMVPVDADGAAEEGSPHVPAHEMRRFSFVPRPFGFRFYHTHVPAGGDLKRSLSRAEGVRAFVQPGRRYGDGCPCRRAGQETAGCRKGDGGEVQGT
jgi:FtsP/CotA-like multicopper oxidase with cupredoxin domain